MKQQWCYISVFLFLFITMLPSHAVAAGDSTRHFMFIGEPSAEAWQFLMEHPEGRKADVSETFQALGGKIVSYYFGLGDGKTILLSKFLMITN